MQLSRATTYALRISYSQSGAGGSPRQSADRLVGPSALLLATLGISLSSFSVKQMLSSAKRRF